MANAQIETAVFHLGGILIDRDPRCLYRKIFGRPLDEATDA